MFQKENLKSMKRKAVQVLLLPLARGTLVTLLSGVRLLESLELRSLDMRFRLLAQRDESPPGSLVFGTSNYSLPFPRLTIGIPFAPPIQRHGSAQDQ